MNHIGQLGGRQAKRQLRPAPKSGNIAGLHGCCFLLSLVYGSVLVTLETAVGAYRGTVLLCSRGTTGRGVPWCVGKGRSWAPRADLWGEGSGVKRAERFLSFTCLISLRVQFGRRGPPGKI